MLEQAKELERLSGLHKSGELTDQEFAAAKRELLGSQVQERKPRTVWRWVLFIAVVIFVGRCASNMENDISTTPYSLGPQPVATSEPGVVTTPLPEPVLEVASWNWYTEGSFAYAEGAVKNLTKGKLENVEAVVSFYDNDRNMITSDDALLKYTTLLPGQTSPFKVIARYNPAIRAAQLEFKELLGGPLTYRYKQP